MTKTFEPDLRVAEGRADPPAPEPPHRSRRVDTLVTVAQRLRRGSFATPHLYGEDDEAKVRYEFEGAQRFWDTVEPWVSRSILDEKDVLDLGCGWGGKVVSNAEHTRLRHITGFDLPGLYDPAVPRTFASERGVGNCTFLTARGESMPFPDDCFDVVLSDDVLEHVQDPGMVLSEVQRVLRPRGVLVASFPSIRMIGAHHLDRALTLPAAHYLISLRTWAAGLNHRRLHSPGAQYEPFDRAVRSRFGRRWLTSNLNGLDVPSFRRLVDSSGLRTDVLAIVGVHPERLTRRTLPRWLVAKAAGWVAAAREALGTAVVYVGHKPASSEAT